MFSSIGSRRLISAVPCSTSAASRTAGRSWRSAASMARSAQLDRLVDAIVEHRLLGEQTERERERGRVAELVEVGARARPIAALRSSSRPCSQ